MSPPWLLGSNNNKKKNSRISIISRCALRVCCCGARPVVRPCGGTRPRSYFSQANCGSARSLTALLLHASISASPCPRSCATHSVAVGVRWRSRAPPPRAAVLAAAHALAPRAPPAPPCGVLSLVVAVVGHCLLSHARKRLRPARCRTRCCTRSRCPRPREPGRAARRRRRARRNLTWSARTGSRVRGRLLRVRGLAWGDCCRALPPSHILLSRSAHHLTPPPRLLPALQPPVHAATAAHVEVQAQLVRPVHDDCHTCASPDTNTALLATSPACLC